MGVATPAAGLHVLVPNTVMLKNTIPDFRTFYLSPAQGLPSARALFVMVSPADHALTKLDNMTFNTFNPLCS